VILVDTSVWIEVFRRAPRFSLDHLLSFDDVVTTPPIQQELLQGFRDTSAYRRARVALVALPTVDAPLPLERFLEAAELYRAARAVGITPRSSVDCLIAASAIHHDLEVLHADRDYVGIARVSSLRQRAV